MIHSYTTGKSKFPLKYFCCIVLWHTCLVPEYMKNSKWLSLFAVCYLKVRKVRCLQNFCSTEKWMMLDIVVKNILKVITVSNNLVFICRFYNHIFDWWNMHFQLKNGLWKLQVESWNANHELLKWTLEKVISMNYGSSTSSWKPWRWARLDLILSMRDLYNSNLKPLKKFPSSRRTPEFKDILPWSIFQMITWGK